MNLHRTHVVGYSVCMDYLQRMSTVRLALRMHANHSYYEWNNWNSSTTDITPSLSQYRRQWGMISKKTYLIFRVVSPQIDKPRLAPASLSHSDGRRHILSSIQVAIHRVIGIALYRWSLWIWDRPKLLTFNRKYLFRNFLQLFHKDTARPVVKLVIVYGPTLREKRLIQSVSGA